MRTTFLYMEVFLVKPTFIKSPITCAVALALYCSAPATWADTLNGQTRTVNEGNTTETWQLINGATLNATEKATTDTILASSGSTVNLTGSTTLSSTGVGVKLNQSTANITGATIISTGDYGLMLTTIVGGTLPSTATVTNSTITGQLVEHNCDWH